jgi:hypothetical protein
MLFLNPFRAAVITASPLEPPGIRPSWAEW